MNDSDAWNCSNETSAIIDTIDSIICSSIAVFGILGNLFSILVFHRTTKLRRLPTSVYLVALAVSDTLFLTALLLTMNESLLKRSVFCKTIFYFMNVGGVFSSWLVVLFTVERFVVVKYPLNRMAKCSRRRARYLVSFLVPVPCLMYVYHAVVLIDVDSSTDLCYWRQEYVFVVTVIHGVEIWLTYFVPALVVVALNLRIGLKLIRSDVQRQSMRTGSMISRVAGETCTNADDDDDRGAGAGVIKQISLRFSRSRSLKTTSSMSSGRPRLGSASRAQANDHAATRMLFVISMAFAVLNLPHNLVLLAKLFVQLTPQLDKLCLTRGDLMNVITSSCNALYYANFAVNIVVYHLTSSNYRQGARQLLTRSIRFLLSVGRRPLVAFRIVDGGTAALERNPVSPVCAGKSERRMILRRRCNDRQNNEKTAAMAGDRFAFIRKFRRNKPKKANDCKTTELSGCNAIGWYQNEHANLSTIPEADAALTDPRSNH